LLPKNDPYKTAIGAGVYDTGHLIPPLAVKMADTDNVFDTLFGIEFKYMNATLVRSFSPYEFARGFGFGDDLARKLALRTNIHLLTNAIPSFTSVAIFDCIRDRLRLIREKSITVDESTPFAEPAAVSQILLNGATCHPLPDDDRWSNEWFRILLP
jgi:hypothetical protein